MASLICATAMVSTSLSWVSLFLIDNILVAGAGFGVAGVAWLLVVVPVLGVEVVAVKVEFSILVVDCVISDVVSES